MPLKSEAVGSIAGCEPRLMVPSKCASSDSSLQGGEASATTATSNSTVTTNTRIRNSDAHQDFEVKVRLDSLSQQENDRSAVADNSTESKEDLLGTHVSFASAAKDEETSSASDSHQSERDVEDGEQGEEDESECSDECSEADLMAAIAVATARKGEEGSYSAFFTRAEAVAAKELMDQESAPVEADEEARASTEEGLFELIEQQISTHGNIAAPSKTRGSGIADVLEDLERVLFFTDVVDRNPAPDYPSSAAIVLSSSGADPWWEATVREMGNQIYQSTKEVYHGVERSTKEAYHEVERTCKEVERQLLFTDVPDHPAVSDHPNTAAMASKPVNETILSWGSGFSVASPATETKPSATVNEAVLSWGSGFTAASPAAETKTSATANETILSWGSGFSGGLPPTGAKSKTSVNLNKTILSWGSGFSAASPPTQTAASAYAGTQTEDQSRVLEAEREKPEALTPGAASRSFDDVEEDCYVDPLQADAKPEGIRPSAASPQQEDNKDSVRAQAFATKTERQASNGPARKSTNVLKSSHVTSPTDELTRVIKSLEKTLLFTDLPDVPRSAPDGSRRPTRSVSSPTAGSIPSISARSCNSSLGMCQTEMSRAFFSADTVGEKQRSRVGKKGASSKLDSQVFVEDDHVGLISSSALQQRLQARIEKVREQGHQWNSGSTEGNYRSDSTTRNASQQGAVEALETPIVVAEPSDPYLNDLSENGNSIAAPSLLSDLSSDPDPISKKEETPKASNVADFEQRESELKPGPNQQAVPSGKPQLSEVSQEATTHEQHSRVYSRKQSFGYPASPVIKADSSMEPSVRLLCEVKMNNSLVESETNSSFASSEYYDTLRAKSSVEFSIDANATRGGSKEASALPEEGSQEKLVVWKLNPGQSPTKKEVAVAGDNSVDGGHASDNQGQMWTSQDQQNLSSMIDTVISEDSHEVAHNALGKVLASIEGAGSHEDSNSPSWQDCASSLADNGTFATAEDASHALAPPKNGVAAKVVEQDGQHHNTSSLVATEEAFGALLAEMKDLENAINVDLQRANTVLRTTVEATNEA